MKKNNKKKLFVPHWGVKVNHSSYSTVTKEGDHDDQWDADDIQHSFELEGIEPSSENPDLVIPFNLNDGENYYLVTVIFSTGDSFHTETGKHEFIDLFKTKEAAEACKTCITAHYELSKKSKTPKGFDQYSLHYLDELDNPKKTSPCWVGYFEGLEHVQIDECAYNPKLKNKFKR